MRQYGIVEILGVITTEDDAPQPNPEDFEVEEPEHPDAILPHSAIEWKHHNVSDWPITVDLTEVRFGTKSITLKCQRDWPGGVPLSNHPNLLLDSNPWCFANIGHWYAATYEWHRMNQERKHKTAANIGSPMGISGWKPKKGEEVGFMVSGLARNSTRNVKERSQIVLVKWGENWRKA